MSPLERALPAAGARQLLLALAAFLAGAAGLGLELLFLGLCGLSLGYGRAAPIGLAVFVAGWALGARFAGAAGGRPARGLLAAGAVVLAASIAFPPALLAAGAGATGGLAAASLAGLAILAVALPQGTLLPWLARGWRTGERAGVAALFAANLAGAAAGAWAFGSALPAAYGRWPAALAAGAAALAAGALGAAVLRRRAAPGTGSEARLEPRAAPAGRPDGSRGDVPPLDFPLAGLLVVYLTGFGLTCEWIALRLGVLWFGGMQPALTRVLLASLLALALGAAAAPILRGRGRLAVVGLVSSACVLSVWMTGSGRIVERLPSGTPDLLRALVLLGPALLPFGAAVPVLHRELERSDAASLGRLLGYEAAGALVGIPFSHFVLVPRLGIRETLGIWSLLALPCFLLLLPRYRSRALLGAALAVVIGAFGFAWFAEEPALESPPLSNPALRVLAFDEDEHFAVAVVEDGLLGERTLLTDGFRAAGTGESYRYMRALGHLPLLLHPSPKRVAVLALGTGTTAGAVSLHPEVEHIEILELSRAVARFAPWFEEVNRGVLAEGLPGVLHEDGGANRVRLRLGDGRRLLGESGARYDVITMEPLLPSSPFAVYLYTREFYERARRALAPGGLLCQWVPPHAQDRELFDAIVSAFTSSFAWSGLFLFGTQLALVGGASEPSLDASRFDVSSAELAGDLAFLGLDASAGLVARFVGAGNAWPRAARPLTDGDPWIVYRALPEGRDRLAMLPDALALLRERATPAPAGWLLGLGAAELARIEGLEALRRAREAFAVERADEAGVELASRRPVRNVDGELAEARRLAPSDPEVEAFARELDYARSRREGLSQLALDRGAGGARRALDPLLRCAELEPGRADAHLLVAVALERMGELVAARAALSRATELCPRIRETSAGEQARALGFPSRADLVPNF